MLTQFGDYASESKPALAPVSMSASMFTSDSQRWEEAFTEVDKILDARIAYNETLEKFFLSASEEEMELFLTSCFNGPFSDIYTSGIKQKYD